MIWVCVLGIHHGNRLRIVLPLWVALSLLAATPAAADDETAPSIESASHALGRALALSFAIANQSDRQDVLSSLLLPEPQAIRDGAARVAQRVAASYSPDAGRRFLMAHGYRAVAAGEAARRLEEKPDSQGRPGQRCGSGAHDRIRAAYPGIGLSELASATESLDDLFPDPWTADLVRVRSTGRCRIEPSAEQRLLTNANGVLRSANILRTTMWAGSMLALIAFLRPRGLTRQRQVTMIPAVAGFTLFVGAFGGFVVSDFLAMKLVPSIATGITAFRVAFVVKAALAASFFVAVAVFVDRSRLGACWDWSAWRFGRAAVVWSAVSVGLVVFANQVFVAIGSAGRPEADSLVFAWSAWRGLPVESSLAVLATVLAVPILEELLFRGILYGSLRNLMTAWLAVPISSLVFAASHVGVSDDYLGLFVFGMIAAGVYQRSGLLLPCVVAHAALNFSAQFATLFL